MPEEKYYYIRDKDNKPIITVCLLRTSDDTITRGIAVCSGQDIPCKKVGRKIARARAEHAWRTEKDSCWLARKNKENVEWAIEVFPSPCKAIYNPVLTEFEKLLFTKEEDQNEYFV